ncbi:MAG: MATE family efflux transporter [Oscillospiraceae bacterium]|nr:MATE family efflux transporter [Oscillospiraceae bacterium]
MSRTVTREDIVNGPVLKSILRFSFPLMLTNFLSNLFSAVDTIVVGKYAGSEALAAVGATGSLIFMVSSLFNGLSMGASVVVGQMIGRGNESRAKETVETAFIMAGASGLFLSITGLLFSKVMLRSVSTPANILDQSSLYMRIYLGASVFMLIYNFGAAILRAKGDTLRPLYYIIASGLTNVILNLVFVVKLHLGTAGVATATLISQAVSAILVTYSLVTTKDVTQLDLKQMRFNPRTALEILRIGIPSGIQTMMFSVSNVVMQRSINSFDSSDIIAGNTAGSNLENFCYIAMMAFTQACVSFTSQNYGARKYEKLRKIMYLSLVLVVIGSLTVSGFIWAFHVPLLSLYTGDPEVIRIGTLRVLYVILPLFLNGILDVFAGSLRGMGRSSLPMITMVVGICGVRLAWLWGYFPSHRSLEVIYLSYSLSWFITSVLEYILWLYVYRYIVLPKKNIAINLEP